VGSTYPDSEDALEQATLALFRQMGWDTVNCMDEVFGDVPASPRRPNLRHTCDLLPPRLGEKSKWMSSR